MGESVQLNYSICSATLWLSRWPERYACFRGLSSGSWRIQEWPADPLQEFCEPWLRLRYSFWQRPWSYSFQASCLLPCMKIFWLQIFFSAFRLHSIQIRDCHLLELSSLFSGKPNQNAWRRTFCLFLLRIRWCRMTTYLLMQEQPFQKDMTAQWQMQSDAWGIVSVCFSFFSFSFLPY